jgi:hypothetical protein
MSEEAAVSELDRLEAAIGECREMIREAHAATKDLRAAVREAKRETQDLAKDEVAAHIQREVSRQLEELGERTGEAVSAATQKVIDVRTVDPAAPARVAPLGEAATRQRRDLQPQKVPVSRLAPGSFLRVVVGGFLDVLDRTLDSAVRRGLARRRPRLCERSTSVRGQLKYLARTERTGPGVMLYDPGSRPEPPQQLTVVAPPRKDHARHAS